MKSIQNKRIYLPKKLKTIILKLGHTHANENYEVSDKNQNLWLLYEKYLL